MHLCPIQKDRAGGVLLGQAIGDALGVPYEFAPRTKPGAACMKGGGLGPYQPGEWSDDTQMALCIALVTAAGGALNTDDGLNEVAERFIGWMQEGATDIGAQTRHVLELADRGTMWPLDRMLDAATTAGRAGRAGNGALMRTGVVGLVALDSPAETARAAARVAQLTHAADDCVDSSVLWSEAVRVAVVEGRLDARAGLDLLPAERRTRWAGLIDEAEASEPASFNPNGWTVTAFQAVWSAIHATRHLAGHAHVEAALQLAVGIGHDTDTVAAITGALLGARYGVSGTSWDLVRRVHGWPGLRARDLVRLGLLTAARGRSRDPWLAGASMLADGIEPLGVPHPEDPVVLLGTEAVLARCAELGVTAVVSLSRVGAPDVAAAGVEPGKHLEFWLVDSDVPDDNADIAGTIRQAAEAVRALRAEGERVLLHCVRAQHRTPSVALAYSRLLGVPTDQAARRITDALGVRTIDGLLWATASRENA